MGTMRLGAIQIDPARNVIANGGASWSLEPKIMDLLVFMAARPGEVLSREALIDNVWKVEFGADESLTRAVSLLRKTFREAGHSGEIIETIPKRGYRLTVTLADDAGGPEAAPVAAQVAPARSETVAPKVEVAAPAPAPAPAPVKRSPFVLWGGIAAAVFAAIVAVVALMPKAGSAEGNPKSQLFAFYGFTPAGDDPSVKATAEAATDATFESMRSSWFDTVARTETRGVKEDRRFERAAELGARYAMSGDVRANANTTSLSIRIEDVASRLTLWEESISSPSADVAYLPAQVAWRINSVVWCMVKTREALTRETTELLGLIADRCRDGGAINGRNASYVVSRMRAIAEADPNSAYNQAQLVNLLGLGVQFAPAPSKATWIAEGEAALKRAGELDPHELNVLLARISLGYGKNIPAAEWDALLLDAQAKAEAKDNFALASANGYRAALLSASGRFAEALPHAVARAANKSVLTPGTLGMALAYTGQVPEARAELNSVYAAYGPQVWDMFLTYAVFLNAPDADMMLSSPPSTVPKATIDCLHDIRSALVSTDARAHAAGVKKVHACKEAGLINWRISLPALSALGDLDGAFREAGERSFSTTAIRAYDTAPLFYPQTRAMRADPRFLPLVEKLGMMDYWRATKSQPDVCGTEAAPFCVVLKTANAKP